MMETALGGLLTEKLCAYDRKAPALNTSPTQPWVFCH
jgi:hypothetical protein